MKQKKIRTLLFLLTAFLLTGCFSQSQENSLRERAENYLAFSLPEAAIIENENDFLPVIPDGCDYFKIEIPANDATFMQNLSGWSELPYAPEEQLFFFGSEDEYFADHYEVGVIPNDGHSYFSDEEGHVYKRGEDGFFDDLAAQNKQVIPPDIMNGKYWLTEYDKDERGNLLSFTLRVYDSDASVLYIFYYDS